MSTNSVVLGAALAAICLVCTGQKFAHADEPFDLRGIKLGITADEFRKMPHPDNPKVRVFCTGDKMPEDSSLTVAFVDETRQKAGISECIFFEYIFGRYRNSGLAVLQYGVEPKFTFFQSKISDPPRLHQIVFDARSDLFGEFLKAFTERFGRPKITTHKVQNQIGNWFNSTTAIWTNSPSSISSIERGNILDRMVVVYAHTELTRAAAARIKAVNGPPKL